MKISQSRWSLLEVVDVVGWQIAVTATERTRAVIQAKAGDLGVWTSFNRRTCAVAFCLRVCSERRFWAISSLATYLCLKRYEVSLHPVKIFRRTTQPFGRTGIVVTIVVVIVGDGGGVPGPDGSM